MNEYVDYFWSLSWKACIAFLFLTFHYVNYLRRKRPTLFGNRCSPVGWKFGFKKIFAYIEINVYQKWIRRKKEEPHCLFPSSNDKKREKRRTIELGLASDQLRVQCLDVKGNSISFALGFYEGKRELLLQVALADGTIYQTIDAPFSHSEFDDGNTEVGWAAGGLTFEIVEAKKRFRFCYNGIMKKIDQRSESSNYHVRLNFVWSAGSPIIDVRNDWHPSLMSDALARETWNKHEWQHLVKDQGRGFDQWGVARGIVRVDSNDPIELNLLSLRQRRWGAVESDTLLHRMTVMGITEDGLCFYIRSSSHPIGLTYARFGHVLFPNGICANASDCEILINELPEKNDEMPSNALFSITAKGKVLDGHMAISSEQWIHGHRFSARFAPIHLNLAGQRGIGIMDVWYRDESERELNDTARSQNTFCCENDGDSDDVILEMTDPAAKNVNLTGGKGSSLAVLSTLSSLNFEVPKGFCITVNALEEYIRDNPAVCECINRLQGKNYTERQHYCQSIEDIFKVTPISTELLLKLQDYLQFTAMPVAVRSSGVGEDGEESSSAGQNATFLGLRNIDSIVTAIRMCWASLYSFKSVQYRLEHGQPLISKMAVVVQEMVSSDRAGVLFTEHPVSHDPRRMLITANLGLGETVVSGSVEPDSIEVMRKTSTSTKSTEFEVISIDIGKKDLKIVISEDGTKEEILSDLESLTACLDKEQCIKLAEIGKVVEDIYGKPRDIEWAIHGEKIYLLQARPITTSTGWIDHELLHELDTPVFSNLEVCSTANTGEVFPGATSALTLTSTLVSLVEFIDSRRTCTISHHHVFLDVMSTSLQAVKPTIDVYTRIIDLAVMGHEFTTPKIHALAIRRNGIAGKLTNISQLLQQISAVFGGGKAAREAKKLCQAGRIDFERNATIDELFESILKLVDRFFQLMRYHKKTSPASAFTQVMLFVILADNKELTNDGLSDISTILSSSSSKSVSSGIPRALKALARIIAAHHTADQFSTVKVEEAIPYLVEHHPAAADLWMKFIDQFGHRGWRELDLATDVWAFNPPPVIQTLQTMVKQNVAQSDSLVDSSEGNSDVIDTLMSVMPPGKKWFLRKLVKLCQSAVNNRETTKEALIVTTHDIRVAVKELGQRLVSANLLPRPSLIFHLTIPELREFLTSRRGDLIVKASKRQRLHKRWDLLEFPEVMIGNPQPIEKSTAPGQFEENSNEIAERVIGTPVYLGQVEGRVLVARVIEDMVYLEPGDILITYSTDIGWSPYFPLLNGVVTELGGLISHGAVVAREYGIPCLIGAEGATTVFETGDMVILNATSGYIEKSNTTDF